MLSTPSLSSKSYSSLSLATIDLLNLLPTLVEQPREQAIELLERMKSQVHTLEAASLNLARQAQQNSNSSEARLEVVENQINQMSQDQDNLRQRIREIEANLASAQTQKKSTEEDRNRSLEQVEQLKNELRNLQERREEAKKYACVPFYGLGLNIRNLVDNDIPRYHQAVDDLNEYTQNINDEQAQIASLNATITNLNELENSDQQKIQHLKELKNNFQQERVQYKKGVTFFNQVALYYRTLEQKFETVGNRIEDINDIVEYLNSSVTLSLSGDGEDEVMALQDALVRCGEYADTISLDSLFSPQTAAEAEDVTILPMHEMYSQNPRTINLYLGEDGGYIAIYSHNANKGIYSVGDGIYVIGMIRLKGSYVDGIFYPVGYGEGMDISKAEELKQLADHVFPSACRGDCWAGGDTGEGLM